MDAIWYYAIGFAIIWLIALIFKDKLVNYGVDVSFPTIMWKTKRLRGLIDRIANLSPWFWKWFMNLGILISFGAMIIVSYLLLSSLSTITETTSVSLVIPGVDIPGSPIFIPFVYGIIALATVIIVHEFAHGILARREKVTIKSIGLLLFAILPGAFVEPEEDEIKNIKKIPRMRIYAAGSIANFSLAIVAFLIFLLITSFVIPATFEENGFEIDRVISGTPAHNVLKPGMIMNSINGHNVSDAESYSKAVSTLKPGEMVVVVTNQGTYNFTAGTNPNNKSLGYMGVKAIKNLVVKSDVSNIFGDQLPWAWFYLREMFKWIFFLNFAVGLFNILPMKPLDGGHLLENLLRYALPDNIVNPVITVLSYFFIFVIAISLIAGLGNGLF